MNKQSPTILFVREVPWNSFYPISTRKLAGEFAANGWNVIWLTDPLMPWKTKPRNEFDVEKISTHTSNGVIIDNNILAYTPRSYAPFSRYFPLHHPWLADKLWHWCFPSIPKIIRANTFPNPDVLWLSTFHSAGLQRLFPEAISIAHVHDNFSGYDSTPDTCKTIETKSYSQATHLVAATPSLKRMLIRDFCVQEPNISIITSGVDFDTYQEDYPCPSEISALPHPRIVSVGNTSKLDLEVIKSLLSNPEISCSVIIIGPITSELDKLRSCFNNLHLIGPLPKEKVPKYLKNCDVGLILLKPSMAAAAEHTGPMKLYEYAAAGLPIISSPLPVYRDIDININILFQNTDITRLVKKSLSQQKHQSEKMLFFAKKNSWGKKYLQALEVIRLCFENSERKNILDGLNFESLGNEF